VDVKPYAVIAPLLQEPFIVVIEHQEVHIIMPKSMRWSMGTLLNLWFSQQQVEWLIKQLFYYKYLASLLFGKRN